MDYNEKSIMKLLGLAQKAGNIASGAFSVQREIRDSHAWLVILSEDASDNTKKKFLNLCRLRHVPVICMSDMRNLGHCIGRDDTSVMALVDEGFAQMIEKALRIQDVRR